MRTPISGYEARFGIASSHWTAFQQVANQMNKIIMIALQQTKRDPVDREQLNAAMAGGSCVRGQPRIQHGTQAQVDLGSPMNRDPTRPGDESILVFYAKPRNRVELLSCNSVEEGREELKTIMRENLPATGAGPQGGTVIQGPWAKR